MTVSIENCLRLVAKLGFDIPDIDLTDKLVTGRPRKIASWLIKYPTINEQQINDFYVWYKRNFPHYSAPRELHAFIGFWYSFLQDLDNG